MFKMTWKSVLKNKLSVEENYPVEVKEFKEYINEMRIKAQVALKKKRGLYETADDIFTHLDDIEFFKLALNSGFELESLTIRNISVSMWYDKFVVFHEFYVSESIDSWDFWMELDDNNWETGLVS